MGFTDLVFIDPVSTGYSRSEKGISAKRFHGYEEDINSIGEFIRSFISQNNLWGSPKFIAGESYVKLKTDAERFYREAVNQTSRLNNYNLAFKRAAHN